MKTVKRTFYSDPSHGWLEVDYSELAELGVLKQISSCSYRRGNAVYLEEDCDAGVYINAMKARGYSFVFEERDTNHESAIRSYCAYYM